MIRTHGGAIAKEKKTFDAQTPFAKRRKLHTEKKRQLAHIARGFLKEHDRIFLASGSTMDMFASALLHYLPLTVVTDAVNVAYELYQDSRLTIFMLGGELRSNSPHADRSDCTDKSKNSFSCQKAFFKCECDR